MANISSGLWTDGKRSRLLDTWPLYRDPITVPLILVGYLAIVLYILPRFMKNRAPYNLKYVIIMYNAMQVLYNAWFVSLSIFKPNIRKNVFHFNCEQSSPQDRLDYEALVYLIFWHITVNKLLDLLDTTFFVLRKKQNHVTFLHVQHHILSVSIPFVCAKYTTGHEFAVPFICNTTVHTVMYFYYLLASLGPAYKKYLWWKKHVTIMQMVQFVIIGTYGFASLRLSCGLDHRVVCVIIFNSALNFALFFRFFLKTYNSKKQATE